MFRYCRPSIGHMLGCLFVSLSPATALAGVEGSVQNSVDIAIKRISDGEIDYRKAWEELKHFDNTEVVESIIRVLNRGVGIDDERVRTQVYGLLIGAGAVNNDRGFVQLTDCLDNETAMVAGVCGAALIDTGSAHQEEAYQRVAGFLKRRDITDVGHNSARHVILGRLGARGRIADRYYDVLLQMLKDSDDNDGIRASAASAIVRVGGPARVAADYSELDAKARKSVVYQVGGYVGRAHSEALRGGVALSPEIADQLPKLQAFVAKVLQDSDSEVRKQGFQTMRSVFALDLVVGNPYDDTELRLNPEISAIVERMAQNDSDASIRGLAKHWIAPETLRLQAKSLHRDFGGRDEGASRGSDR